MEAGDLISHLRLDNKQFKKSLRESEQHAKASFDTTKKAVKDLSRRLEESVENFGKRSANVSNKVAKNWWRTFGEVAVGFTIAYRAMNAFEEGLKKLIGTFITGRQAIDDFRMAIVEVAASLQMLTEEPSIEGLETYYKFAKGVFNDLEVIAAKHISTGEDLRNAYAKLATMGIVPQTEKQLEQMARLVDLIIIQTKGLDKQRQIRTELQAFVLGEMRQGAVMARMMSQRIEGYDELIDRMQQETSVAKRTQMILGGTEKVLNAIGSVSKDIQKTHTALWTTLTAILNKIQRVGLLQMYEDLLDLMIGIRDALMDQNGLTDLGIKLATTYHTVWASVWGTAKAVFKVLRDILWIMSPLATLLKYAAATTVVIAAGWEKIGAIFMMDLLHPESLAIRLTNIHDEMIKTLDDILMSQEEMQAKYTKQLKAYRDEMSDTLSKLAAGQDEASDKAIKALEKWIEGIESLEEKYLVLSKVLESVKGTVFTDEDLKSFKWLWETTAKWKEVPEELRSKWMEVQIALSRVTKELELAGERSKTFMEISELKERFSILSKVYDMLKKGEITPEQVDRATKIEELERKRLKLAELIGEEEAAKWLLYKKGILNLEDLIELEGKALGRFKVDFKEINRLIEKQAGLLKGPTIAEYLKKLDLIISGGRRRISESEWEALIKPTIVKADLSIGKSFEKLIESFKKSGLGFKEAVQTASTYFVSSITGGAVIIGEAIIGILDALTNFVTLPARIFDAASSLLDAIMNFPVVLAEAVENFAEKLTSVISTLARTIIPSAVSITKSAFSLLNPKNWIKGFFGGGGYEGPTYAEVWRGMRKEIEDLFSSTTKLEDAIEEVNNKFNEWINSIKSFGVKEEELTKIENLRAEAIQRLIDTQKEQIEESIIDRLLKVVAPEQATYISIIRDFAEIVEQLRNLSEITGEGYEDLIDLAEASFAQELRNAVMQTDAIRDLKDSLTEWQRILVRIRDQILGIQTSLASPADVFERMSSLEEEIASYLGAGWLQGSIDATNLTAEETEKVRGLLGDYLKLGQEAWQRPSNEYQALYDVILISLGELESVAENIVSEYELQYGQLNELLRGNILLEGVQDLLSQGLTFEEAMATYLSQISSNIMAGIPVDVTVDLSKTFPEVSLITEPISAPIPEVPVISRPEPTPWPQPAPWVPPTFEEFAEKFPILSSFDLQQFYENFLSMRLDEMEQYWKDLNAPGLESYQFGTSYVPETGPYILHKGEAVIPAGESGNNEFNLYISIDGSISPYETAISVRREVEGFLRSSAGRKAVQLTAQGR